MKRNNFLIRVSTFLILMFLSTSLFAQFGQLGQVLSTGKDDAEKILGAYFSPYTNGMGAALSTGWYNSAKPHKLGGFDISLSFNLAVVPSADKTFNALDLNLGDSDNGISVDVTDGSSPTAAGKNSAGQQVTYYKNIAGVDVPITQINMPKGTGFGYVPAPMLQLGIGLVKETDLLVRYSPNLEWGNGSKMGLWGIGLKHSLKQWIPAINKLPLFQMSLQGGYTKLSSTTALSFMPSFYQDAGIIRPGDIIDDSPEFYGNQELLLDVSNLTANLLLSLDLKVICLYGGVGISNTKTNLKLNGNFPVPEVQGVQLIVTEETALKDPIDISIKSSDGSATKPRFNAGLRFKFAVVTINFDYTYANYSVASAGLGINFR